MDIDKVEEKTRKLNRETKYYRAKVAHKKAKKAASPFKKLPTVEIKIGKKRQGKVIKKRDKRDKRIHLF